ncbi:MAG: protoheme IX farnesyltransferase [Planctomycetota bacterium]
MTPPTLAAELVPAHRPAAAAVAHPVALAQDEVAGLRSVVADVSRLVRPRIAIMVLATVVAAAWLTAGRPADPVRLAWLLVGTALVAASSSVANQILERSSDRLMRRTAARPIAAGRLSVSSAWAITAATLVLGGGLCWFAAGWAPAAAALATWLLYVLAYTPLKRITPLNTAVGAVAGALPVAIGWLAADGPARLAAGDARGALAAAALATVLYLWQFPHFMAIAWLYRSQYAAAGAKMLTVVDPTGLRAGGQALAAALALVPAALVLAVPSGSVRMFLSAAVAAGVYLLATVAFAVRRDDAAARFLLLSSLGALLGLIAAAVVFGGPA